MSDFKPSSDLLSFPWWGREHSVSGNDLWQWREQAQAQAIAVDISVMEVDWLLQALSDLDRLALRFGTFRQREVKMARSLSELSDLWQQRINQRVPVQYLAGVAPWRQFHLHVSPAVLIPRPETECLIDLAIAASQSAYFPVSPAPHWVDLGTGSGAIALGLATAFPSATIHAVDTSAAALGIAQTNAQIHHLHDRIQFYQGSWWQPIAHLRGQLSGVVSNPPYIPQNMVPDLQPEVAQHEPHLALDGGPDGLDCIRHLIATAPEYLQTGGVLLLEMMAGQAPIVTELLRSDGRYQSIHIHADLAGIERFALAHRRES